MKKHICIFFSSTEFLFVFKISLVVLNFILLLLTKQMLIPLFIALYTNTRTGKMK